MIWIWIAAAVLITLFLLRNKNIAFHHFIWILLPIDLYGVTVAGVTIKPYMIFVILILLRNIIRGKGKIKFKIKMEWALGLLFLFFMTLSADLFNGSGEISLMQHIMFMLVFLCALIYISSIESHEEFVQIRDTIVATVVGFGLVYIFAIFTSIYGLDIGGTSTWVRENPGIILKFIDVPDGRLRGFCIDPNAFATSLMPAITFSIYQLFEQKEENKFMYIAVIIISLSCCYYTKSRMALLCFLFVIMFTIFSALKLNNKKIGKAFVVILLLLCIMTLSMLIFYGDALSTLVGNLLQQYEGRSEFGDTYGRGSLWESAWNALYENNLFFGVGQGLVNDFSVLGKDSHNTWLEWIVGSGIIAGSLVDLFFLLIFFKFSKYCRKSQLIPDYSNFLFGTKWAYIGIVIILLSVSNITNSYLIFTACLMMSLMSGREMGSLLSGKKSV